MGPAETSDHETVPRVLGAGVHLVALNSFRVDKPRDFASGTPPSRLIGAAFNPLSRWWRPLTFQIGRRHDGHDKPPR